MALKAWQEEELLYLADEDAKEAAREDLLAFISYTKDDYEVAWHNELMCQYLDKWVKKEILRLMIFMPPRNGKTEAVSRRMPAFILGQNPNARIIGAAYGDSLASANNRDVQRIIDSPEYKELFPDTNLNGENIRTVAKGSWLRNSDEFEVVGSRGGYKSAGVGGGLTGRGADYFIIDDPIKSDAEADSPVYRDRVEDWYNSVAYTRLEKNGSMLITMTRWHEDDLAGRLIKKMKSDPEADQFVILNLPAILDNEIERAPGDNRQLGEPLWPWKYPFHRLNSIRASAGQRVWEALYQQRPSALEGNIVQRSWWKFWKVLPGDIQTYCLSADLTFKDGEKSDFAVFQVWAKRGADKFLVDQVRARMGFNVQIQTMKMLCAKWPQISAKYIEDAANGAALIDHLRKDIPGIIAVKPRGSKISRAESITPQIEAGNVYLPDPSIASWISEYIEEWANFPNGTNDDQVDTSTQAISKLTESVQMDWMPISLTQTSKWYK